MDERLRSILAGIDSEALAEVASAALGLRVARLGPVDYAEILKPHADARTIGIVRVSGMADMLVGPSRPWSSVTKIIDKSVPPHWKDAVDPEVEVQVYERQLFARSAGQGFRPARCYHISRPGLAVTVLWLEDLSGASGPPFDIAALSQMAGHLGEWNATIAASPPGLDFAIGHDFQVRSWVGWGYPERAVELAGMANNPMVQAMYAHQSLELASELAAAFGKIVEWSRTSPHALALADCPVSNFFHRPGETIAIDWAGLGHEPIGADGGRFIGSALTFGRTFADVAECERELFGNYSAGLVRGGYGGRREDVRKGYLSQLGFYLNNIAVFPTVVFGARPVLSREFFEKRFAMPLEEFGAEAARVIDLLPSYVAEARRLLD